MTLTTRGKALVAGGVIVALLAGGLLALMLSGNAPGPLANIVQSEPTPCPLTGVPRSGDREPPARPALAIKVENTSTAQPLAGLAQADLVYEEVVEGGITRFIVVFHCRSTGRVGPVRSARTTDPKVLLQLNEHPLLAYSGGANKVVRLIKSSGVIGMTEGHPAAAFTRDDARSAPHNLFANTVPLWAAGTRRAKGEPAPRELFEYDKAVPKPSKKVTSVSIEFPLTPVEWRWEGGRWLRMQDSADMLLEDGSPVAFDNIVIQQVRTTEGDIIDALGYPSPEVEVTGAGKAWLLRNGKLVTGTWSRPAESDLTEFTAKNGDTFRLKPGRTFVELVPTGMFTAPVSFER